MSLERVNREMLQEGVTVLDQSLHNHRQWFSELTRTLVCRLTPDKHDVSKDACHHCRFGQWYDAVTVDVLKQHPGFIAMGEAHAYMHDITAQLLVDMQNGLAIKPFMYDQFVNAREKLELEVIALRNEMEALLYHRDPLTGAINRVDMLPYLREQLEIVKRMNQSTCLVMMDIDFFKKVNDRYGHLAGDATLVATANFLFDNLRPYDKVFRYGGEEFLVCLPNTSKELAYEMMERIRKGITTLNIHIGNDIHLSITASFGIALLRPDETVETTLEYADKALYKAKENGRNLTSVWSA